MRSICGGALALFLILAAAMRADEFPAELVRFRPSERNPLFTAAGPGHWDAKIRERGWILREGDQWRMWYTGWDGTPTGTRRLGLATSPDGFVWTRAADHPLDRDKWIEDVQVIRYGDTYLLFAEGEGDQAHWFTSRDGVSWRRQGPLDVRTTAGEPIPPGPYGTPTVWCEEGLWWLFYERSDNGVWLARSTDLAVWTHVRDEPVLSPGPEPYDREKIALNQIIRHEGRYYAYYHGSGSRERPRLWTTSVATSTDLVHWKKYAGNPLTPERDNQSSGILVFDGRQNRLYTMHDRVDVRLAEPCGQPAR